MSPLEQVLAAAKSIAVSGKKPTLALIKTKLGTSVAMPILIQGLQQFKSMPQSEQQQLQELPSAQQNNVKPTPSDDANKIAQLEQQIASLKQEYQLLNERITQLEQDPNRGKQS